MRSGLLVLTLFLVASCGGSTDPEGSQTHWLDQCTTTAECGSELACICGVCTTACSSVAECRPRGSAAACFPVDTPAIQSLCSTATPIPVCLLQCASAAECKSGQVCSSGVCARPRPGGPSDGGIDSNDAAGESVEIDAAGSTLLDAAVPDATVVPSQDALVGVGGCQGGGHWVPMSDMNAPSARGYHGAVWTGSEMLVWGGSGTNGPAFDGGGRYDPKADQWSAISMDGSPPGARRLFGSVWTGSEWIIWGGNGGSTGGVTDTGSKLNLRTGKWSAMATMGAPPPHYGIRMEWTGALAVFWGGGNAKGGPSQEGRRYDPILNVWGPVAPWSPSVGAMTAIWTGSEYIYWGLSSNPGGSASSGRYDPVADSWRPMSKAGEPSPRQNPFFVWTGKEFIIWGGTVLPTPGPLANGARYNPTSDTWTPMSEVAAPGARHAGNPVAVWTGCRMIVWGGAGGANVFGDGAEYDPETDTWSPLPASGAPSARGNHSVVWTGQEMIVWGGAADAMPLGDGARFVVR